MSYARVPEEETQGAQVPMMPMQLPMVAAPMMPQPVLVPPPLVIPPDPTPIEFEARLKDRRVAFQMDAYFKDAWQLVASNFCIFFGAMLVWLAILVGVFVGVFALRLRLFGRRSLEDMDGDVTHGMTWKIFAFDIVCEFLGTLLLAYPACFSAFNAVFSAMRTNGQVQFKHFFSGYSRLGDCIKFGAAYFILSTLLFMALWVPGILFSFFTLFSLPMYIDHPDMTIGQSYKLSKRLVANYACSVLGFIVVCVLVLILGVLCVGVGLFVAAPVVFVAKCFCYHHLAGVKGCPLSPGLVMIAPQMPPQYAFVPQPVMMNTITPQAPPSGAPVTYVPVNAPVYSTSQV